MRTAPCRYPTIEDGCPSPFSLADGTATCTTPASVRSDFSSRHPAARLGATTLLEASLLLGQVSPTPRGRCSRFTKHAASRSAAVRRMLNSMNSNPLFSQSDSPADLGTRLAGQPARKEQQSPTVFPRPASIFRLQATSVSTHSKEVATLDFSTTSMACGCGKEMSQLYQLLGREMQARQQVEELSRDLEDELLMWRDTAHSTDQQLQHLTLHKERTHNENIELQARLMDTAGEEQALRVALHAHHAITGVGAAPGSICSVCNLPLSCSSVGSSDGPARSRNAAAGAYRKQEDEHATRPCMMTGLPDPRAAPCNCSPAPPLRLPPPSSQQKSSPSQPPTPGTAAYALPDMAGTVTRPKASAASHDGDATPAAAGVPAGTVHPRSLLPEFTDTKTTCSAAQDASTPFSLRCKAPPHKPLYRSRSSSCCEASDHNGWGMTAKVASLADLEAENMQLARLLVSKALELAELRETQDKAAHEMHAVLEVNTRLTETVDRLMGELAALKPTEPIVTGPSSSAVSSTGRGMWGWGSK
ncbi:hypothetical protein V8C86DRAFT_2506930 [Haematococcus lacustris]